MKVGITLPLAEYPGKQPSYEEIRALARQAEAAGFDSLWCFDHLLFREGGEPAEGIWECWTTLSALAEATARIQLGTLVLCTAFRNPAVLAKMAATLDSISNGRLILGLGAGWHQPEFEAFGIDFADRVSRFEEAVHVIATLLRTGKADFDGRFSWVHGGELRPRGVRPAGPPLLIGGSGPRMLRATARHADLWNACWFGAPSGFEPALRAVGQACAAAGRDPSTLRITAGVNVVRGGRADPPDPRRPVLTGTPADLAAAFAGYRDLGVDHLVCNPNPHHAAAQRALADALRCYRSLPDPTEEEHLR
ncbi:LLM class flavin-dependent oxidoreductase [Streptomyces sp. 5-8]|uniref:LLM class flavin-dependent oxidoreductase n=1 Tax=Streptomyces musisoli TaxID=2802280 RepID=A0ABS1NVW3_9ACTN|nr:MULTISPECIES: LLM class flavin-dependent oxidoreductase [Streptomyces]MBL1104154.1 LLM class flavin-dependent oxidoreductase [Streptomyces musisoli]MBY8840227.1 LLM class flavin-dependent oxidoreductase [Streptomyces sp. SP2-10]